MGDTPQNTSNRSTLGEADEPVLAPAQAAGPRARAEAARRLAEAGRIEDALAEWREALWLDPEDAQLTLGCADLLLAQGRPAEAIEHLQALLRRQPERIEALVRLGEAWLLAADPAKAAGRWRRALDLDPEDPFGLAARLAALSRAAPEALPAAFVRTLFDQYADRFERELVDGLDYRGPEIIAEAVARHGGGDKLAVLDLGCGTGLAGAALKPRARRLDGIDLSEKMVAKARQRGIYDLLAVGDMVDGLAALAPPYDLAVAADAAVYVGDLAPLFAAVAAVAAPGGRFVVTLERHDGADFALGETRRFAHGRGHVERAAAATGWTVRACEAVSTRRDRGQAVPGWLFVLGRKGVE